MEAYRKTIKRRIALLSLVIALFVGILLYDQFLASAALKDSIVFSFQCGFASAASIGIVFLIVRYSKAVNDEEKLRLLYNQEHDERMSAIRSKAGVPMVLILSLLQVFAGMIAGYYNETVFYALLLAATVQLLISIMVKFYYKAKM